MSVLVLTDHPQFSSMMRLSTTSEDSLCRCGERLHRKALTHFFR